MIISTVFAAAHPYEGIYQESFALTEAEAREWCSPLDGYVVRVDVTTDGIEITELD